MGRKRDKLLERFCSNPKDFTYDELRTLLRGFGYEEDQRGSTSGSSVAFFRQRDGLTIYLHKPHPPILKAYQIRAIRQKLKENGDIDE